MNAERMRAEARSNLYSFLTIAAAALGAGLLVGLLAWSGLPVEQDTVSLRPCFGIVSIDYGDDGIIDHQAMVSVEGGCRTHGSGPMLAGSIKEGRCS